MNIIEMHYKEARIHAEGYTWDQVCDELLARYEELGFTSVNAYGEIWETKTQEELNLCCDDLRTWENE